MSNYLSSRLAADPAITIEYGAEVTALHGREKLDAVTVRNVGEARERIIPACALFVMVGAAPNTHWLSGLVDLDEKGFVLTGAAAGVDSPFATSRPGLFAVGDVRSGSVKPIFYSSSLGA
jgi:thioredoxin reductase (NADPH)